MVLYSSNSLSQHVKMDMVLFVDCVLTTSVKKIQLVQYIFMAVRLYQGIPLIYICGTIHFIGYWINKLDSNIAWHFLAHQYYCPIC